MFRTKTFDIETLDQISFERSKRWGTQLNELALQEDGGAFPLVSLEEEYKDDDCLEDDYHTDSTSMEDLDIVENDEILKDITNRTSLLLKVSPIPQGSISMSDNDGKYYDAELRDVLNQTRPLLEEHERKLKDAGLDHVLNTFDPDKIEEKVGGWLRRNNSIGNCSGVVSKSLCPRSHFRNASQTPVIRPRACSVQDSDSESLHSVDTARYIRSSRKRLESKRRVQSSHSRSSMTIKTYRLLQSKRDALREKYACLDIDETLQSGANYFHRFQSRSVSRPGHALPSRSSAKLGNVVRSVADIPRSYRRKRLYKYLDSSSCATSTSFSSSEDECTGKVRYSRRVELQYRRKCSPVRQWSSSCASGYRCLMSKRNSQRKSNVDKIRPRRITVDMRPCRRESECVCYYQDKLCKETRHIADTSTEDWVVEDCETPAKKSLQSVYQQRLVLSVPTKAQTQCKTVKRSLQYVKPANEKTENEYQCADVEQPEKKSREKGTSLKKMVKAKTEIADLDKKQSTKNGVANSKVQSKPKSTRRLKETKMVNSPEESECTFTRELELAIERSKQTYEMELQRVEAKNITNTEAATKPSICTLDEAKILAPKNKGPLMCKPSCSNSVSSLEDSSNNSSPRSLKPQPRSVKMYNMFKTLVTADTFYTESRKICNSTAVKGDKATLRQIMEQNTLTPIRELSEKPTSKTGAKPKSSSQRMPVVSSTKQTSSAADSRATSTCAKASLSSDNDCIIVSSSTDLPKPTNTDKSVLLYAPHHRHLTPAQSLRDGFFHVTLEHLSNVIGEKVARKFMKHYIGRIKFPDSSTVYYRSKANFSNCAESDSDQDELELFNEYGEVYESRNVESQQN